MTVLGIETATPICSVGLVGDQQILAEAAEEAGRRHSVVLPQLIDHVLSESGLSRDRIEGVAVSAGPGSFTGLRIGMGLAKGICLACDLPLAVVSTLRALTVQSGVSGSVCGCLDARHDELYSGVYKIAEGESTESIADAGRPVEDLLTMLGPDTTVAGYGIEPYESRLLDVGLKVLPNVHPTGSAVAIVGEGVLMEGKGTPLDVAEPNYCRRSQAERLRSGEDVR